ncbi:MAG: hypothetical protein WB711_04955, partial [Terriglobales bacterium]
IGCKELSPITWVLPIDKIFQDSHFFTQIDPCTRPLQKKCKVRATRREWVALRRSTDIDRMAYTYVYAIGKVWRPDATQSKNLHEQP